MLKFVILEFPLQLLNSVLVRFVIGGLGEGIVERMGAIVDWSVSGGMDEWVGIGEYFLSGAPLHLLDSRLPIGSPKSLDFGLAHCLYSQ